ncbi:putative exosortase-associated protein, TIGR04073 family [Nitrosomonas sp. Nm51]|uniref:exosortase system-associated protein, TIGR04073 family n=1 Tax=Nitrosomonas sp. Nm51 TaxID=133720 RepID=UPI0008C7A0DC|nr:exosortase system-associated protein, TIGR04073 family [Nitrosomonas sp. Nm51]SEQ78251.1 putative exosortase-associated protein, TIGR04073 family [Nitrosomonas sp. Nm51]
MGKMTKSFCMLLLCLASFPATASGGYGYGLGYGQGYIGMASEKFVTGITNTATGFVELPKNIILTTQKDTIVHGMTIGLVSGIMHTVARTVIGVFDVATFLIPTPPSIQPTFVWQDFSVESSY